MLDLLWSRLFVALAVVLMLSSVSAYFASEREQALRTELNNVARSLASFIDNMLDISGVARFSVGPRTDDDLALPRKIGDTPYRIELRRDSAILSLDGRTSMAHWSGELHFWRWDGSPLDDALIRELDESSPVLVLSSEQSVELILDLVTVASVNIALAFAFLCC